MLCFLTPIFARAASPSGDIKQGNRYYNRGDYDKALEKYKAAEEALPESDIVNFNKGAAYYQKAQYKDAIDAFTQALNTENTKIEADSIYNIANAKYKQGNIVADSDINSAVALYRESLDYYKRAIDLDEDNVDAKYNHELVERELKVLLDRLKNQEQQDNQEQQQDDQGKQDNQGKQQDGDKKEEQTGEDKESESTGSKEEEEKEDRQSRSDREMKEDGSDQQQAAGEESGQERQTERQEEYGDAMSPEEARMLLEAFGEEEARDAATRQKGSHYPDVLKDW